MESKLVIKRSIFLKTGKNSFSKENDQPEITPSSFSYSKGKEQDARLNIALENNSKESIKVEIKICNHENNNYKIKINNSNCHTEKKELSPGINNIDLDFRITFPKEPTKPNTSFKIKFEAEVKSRVFTCFLIP